MQTRPRERSRRGSGVGSLYVAMGILLATALFACDDTQNCFPLNGSCTNAQGFSDFFEPDLPCCEGTCVQTAGPPVSQGTVVRICQ